MAEWIARWLAVLARWVQSKVNRIRLGTRKKVTNAGFTERALMTSQLCHHFQASQAVHGADDITTLHFYNSLIIFGPQVDTLIYC